MKPLFQLGKLLFAGALLYFLVTSDRIDLKALANLTTPGPLLFGLSFMGLMLVLSSERWRLLLHQQGFQVGFFEAWRLSIIGIFFNFFVPGGVGGDLVKAVMITKNHPKNRAKVALTVLVDRVFGLFTMTGLALIAFAFEWNLFTSNRALQWVFYGLLTLFFGFLIIFYILLSRKVSGTRDRIGQFLSRLPKIQKLWLAASSYRMSFGLTVKLCSISFLAQSASIFLFIFVGHMLLAEPPPLTVYFFAVPLGFMVTAIPIAPGGIGVGQAAFFYLFSQALGRETDIGAVAVTAFQALQIAYGILGALFFVIARQRHEAPSLADNLTSENST